jgi:hypothetical protein
MRTGGVSDDAQLAARSSAVIAAAMLLAGEANVMGPFNLREQLAETADMVLDWILHPVEEVADDAEDA